MYILIVCHFNYLKKAPKIQNSLSNKRYWLIEQLKACNIKKIKTDESDNNGPISWIQNISKDKNIYPQQRKLPYTFSNEIPCILLIEAKESKKKMKQDKLRFFCRKISWNRYCKNKKIIRKLFLHSLFYSPFVGWLVMKKPYHWRFLAYFGDFLLDCSAQPWHRWCMFHLDQSSALHDIGLSYIG